MSTNQNSLFSSKYGERKGQKQGGIHAPDPDGGIFKNDTDTFLIKRDGQKPQNDIAEYLASRIFQVVSPEAGAEIELTQSKNGKTFLASKFFKNYQDLFQEEGYKTRPDKTETIQALLKLPQYVKKALSKKDTNNQYKYQGYEQAIVPSLLIGDFSVHSGNIGVVTQQQHKKLVRVDFGAAFRDLNSDIQPFQSVSNRVGLEKNYFLRDHPKKRINSKEFAEEAKKISNIDLSKTINSAWIEIQNFYQEKDIKAFCEQIGMPKGFTKSPESYLLEKMQERQGSLKNFATEIEKNLNVNKININKPKLPKELKKITKIIGEKVKKLIKSNSNNTKNIPSPKKNQRSKTSFYL